VPDGTNTVEIVVPHGDSFVTQDIGGGYFAGWIDKNVYPEDSAKVIAYTPTEIWTARHGKLTSAPR
jgi:hypothetical protein